MFARYIRQEHGGQHRVTPHARREVGREREAIACLDSFRAQRVHNRQEPVVDDTTHEVSLAVNLGNEQRSQSN